MDSHMKPEKAPPPKHSSPRLSDPLPDAEAVNRKRMSLPHKLQTTPVKCTDDKQRKRVVLRDLCLNKLKLVPRNKVSPMQSGSGPSPGSKTPSPAKETPSPGRKTPSRPAKSEHETYVEFAREFVEELVENLPDNSGKNIQAAKHLGVEHSTSLASIVISENSFDTTLPDLLQPESFYKQTTDTDTDTSHTTEYKSALETDAQDNSSIDESPISDEVFDCAENIVDQLKFQLSDQNINTSDTFVLKSCDNSDLSKSGDCSKTLSFTKFEEKSAEDSILMPSDVFEKSEISFTDCVRAEDVAGISKTRLPLDISALCAGIANLDLDTSVESASVSLRVNVSETPNKLSINDLHDYPHEQVNAFCDSEGSFESATDSLAGGDVNTIHLIETDEHELSVLVIDQSVEESQLRNCLEKVSFFEKADSCVDATPATHDSNTFQGDTRQSESHFVPEELEKSSIPTSVETVEGSPQVSVDEISPNASEVHEQTLEPEVDCNLTLEADKNSTVKDISVTFEAVEETVVENPNLTFEAVKEAAVENCNLTFEEVKETAVENHNLTFEKIKEAAVENCNLTFEEVKEAAAVENCNLTFEEVKEAAVENHNLTFEALKVSVAEVTALLEAVQEPAVQVQDKATVGEVTLPFEALKFIGQVQEPLVEQVKKPTVEQVKEPTVEVKEPVDEQFKEPLVEQVKEPTVEVKEPVDEQFKEPLVEQVKELTVEVKEPVDEQFKEPIVERVEEPAVKELKESVEQAKAPTTVAVKEPVFTEVEGPAVDQVKELIVEQVEEPTAEVKEATVEQVKEPIVGQVEEPTAEVKEATVEQVQEPIVGQVEEPTAEVKAATVEQVKEPIVGQVEEPTAEVKAATVEQVKEPIVGQVEEPTAEVKEATVEQVQEPIVGQVEEPTAEVKAATVEQAKELVVEQVEEPTAEVKEATVEQVKEPIVEQVEEPTAEVKEATVELAKELVVEQVEEPTAEVKEATVEQAKELVVEQVEEPTVEVKEATVEQVKEPVVEQVCKSTVEEIQEPTVEQVKELVVEQAEEPTVEKVEKPTVDQVKVPVLGQFGKWSIEEVQEPTVEQVKEPVVEQVCKSTVEVNSLIQVTPNEKHSFEGVLKQEELKSALNATESPADEELKNFKNIAVGAQVLIQARGSVDFGNLAAEAANISNDFLNASQELNEDLAVESPAVVSDTKPSAMTDTGSTQKRDEIVNSVPLDVKWKTDGQNTSLKSRNSVADSLKSADVSPKINSSPARDIKSSALDCSQEDPFKRRSLLQNSPPREVVTPNKGDNLHTTPVIPTIKTEKGAGESSDSKNNHSEAGPDTAETCNIGDELFRDPSTFDFFSSMGSTQPIRDYRKESLYVKFDPLVGSAPVVKTERDIPLPPTFEESIRSGDTTLLPQTPVSSPRDLVTPTKNPALDLVDRLISLSPSPKKLESPRPVVKEEPIDTRLSPKQEEEMIEELHLIREVLARQDQAHQEDLLKHKAELEELQNQLNVYKQQTQEAEEREQRLNKKIVDKAQGQKQMSMIMEEYEKTISRLVAEKEAEHQAHELEKEAIIKEKDLAIGHLSNIEVAFSDVHMKYERSKNIIQCFKKNEEVLKGSLAEFEATIRKQEQKYDMLKSHAMQQLESANQELESTKRSQQAESDKLRAMLKKSELKTSSLEEMLEQKIKENQELASICDDLISKVGN